MLHTISIKAYNVTDNKNGTFTIEYDARDLSTQEQAMLENLFPNLCEAAYKLLSQEALLKLIATPSEISEKPFKK